MENTNKNTDNNKDGTIIIKNGETPKIISATEEKLANFDERSVAQNEDTNGLTAHHNGDHVSEFSLPESNGGDKETETESNTSSLSKNPETPAGLSFVLDDSLNGDNIESSELYNGENAVNQTQVVNDQNEIVETGQSEEVEPEIHVYDAEKVLQKQETYDLICRNCNACITKSVILKIKQKFYTISIPPTPDYVTVPIPEPSPEDTSGVDIIKAIVYGGLLECITSLCVVSSAAGADATTLNIVALGLANAFGGLIVLLNNLRMLKHEHGTERYIDQLGSAGHFTLHAVVAVLSYLVFGLMSPFIFGFAFRSSDNKNYKLATVAATSLVCIASLSTAKAYVQRPPKGYIQTIFHYIVVGFSVACAGYAAGYFINMLLKKLGVFDPSALVAMFVFEAGAINGAWSS